MELILAILKAHEVSERRAKQIIKWNSRHVPQSLYREYLDLVYDELSNEEPKNVSEETLGKICDRVAHRLVHRSKKQVQTEPNPQAKESFEELAMQVREVLSLLNLEEGYVVLGRVEGKTLKEIAADMGFSISKVHSLLRTCQSKLRPLMKREDKLGFQKIANDEGFEYEQQLPNDNGHVVIYGKRRFQILFRDGADCFVGHATELTNSQTHTQIGEGGQSVGAMVTGLERLEFAPEDVAATEVEDCFRKTLQKTKEFVDVS